MRRRILVAVTALMLATRLGSGFSAAQPTSEELSVIEDYLNSNDVQGLRDYLREHAELTQGNSSLASLLRRFMVESAAPGDFFRFDPNLSNSLNEGQSRDGGSALGPAY